MPGLQVFPGVVWAQAERAEVCLVICVSVEEDKWFIRPDGTSCQVYYLNLAFSDGPYFYNTLVKLISWAKSVAGKAFVSFWWPMSSLIIPYKHFYKCLNFKSLYLLKQNSWNLSQLPNIAIYGVSNIWKTKLSKQLLWSFRMALISFKGYFLVAPKLCPPECSHLLHSDLERGFLHSDKNLFLKKTSLNAGRTHAVLMLPPAVPLGTDRCQ